MTCFISNLRLSAGFMTEHPASSDHRHGSYSDGKFLSKHNTRAKRRRRAGTAGLTLLSITHGQDIPERDDKLPSPQSLQV